MASTVRPKQVHRLFFELRLSRRRPNFGTHVEVRLVFGAREGTLGSCNLA